MAGWRQEAINRVREYVQLGQVQFTHKALRELSALELDVDDALDVLGAVGVEHLECRVESEHSGEWLYIFDIEHSSGVALYVKVALRDGCIVVSFHHRT